MSKASDTAYNLINRPRSPLEIMEERQTLATHPRQVVVNGQKLELPPDPSEAPRVIGELREHVID
jgi:hypothetical protein